MAASIKSRKVVSHHHDWMGKVTVALIALVAVVGLVFVSQAPTGAYGSGSGPVNPGFRAVQYDADLSYCASQSDCGSHEICSTTSPGNWAPSCKPSHECWRDADCSGLGYPSTQMACVNGWCHVLEE